MADAEPFVVGARVRIISTGAEGVIVEVFRRHGITIAPPPASR